MDNDNASQKEQTLHSIDRKPYTPPRLERLSVGETDGGIGMGYDGNYNSS
jgi:hypothetical protein